MNDCLFCKIINNEMPSKTIFEDDIVKVMLDAYPNSTGHTLIIPKKHFLDLDDIDIDVLTHIFIVAKKIKLILEEKLKCHSIVLVQNNGEEEKIKHFHLHLLPKYNVDPKLNIDEVFKVLKSEMNELVIGGIYKHFKGHTYKLIFVGIDADNLSEKIVYQNVENNEVWIRDKNDFLSLVDKDKYPKVKQKFRFELQK